MADLQSALSEAFSSAEAGTLAPVADVPIVVADTALPDPVVNDPVETPEAKADRARDEQGRFAAKEAAEAKAAEVAANTGDPATPAIEAAPATRPTTWKKEYLPLYDKLYGGQALEPAEARKLAEYQIQREKEFANGVATYKAEAKNSEHLQKAIEPFLPVLQQHNIEPATWIKNLGAAHQVMALGNPQQKLEMFTRLAQEYGVPLGAVGQPGGGDPAVMQLMEQIQQTNNLYRELSGKVNTVASWREQQEQQTVQQQIAKFQDAEKYPLFAQVRGPMAQLLESGEAADLDDAYEKAAQPLEELINARVAQRGGSMQQAATLSKAKTAAVSPRSSAPSGKPATNAKDIRSSLAEQFDGMSGRV